MPERPILMMPARFSKAALDVAAERERQIRTYGHDATADDAAPRAHLLREAHVRVLDAADLVTGKPEDLHRARRKIVQAGALLLAEIDRIDRQLNHEREPRP